jgi:hypothetical protein
MDDTGETGITGIGRFILKPLGVTLSKNGCEH